MNIRPMTGWMRQGLCCALGFLLVLFSASALAQISNGGNPTTGSGDYTTLTCNYCHDVPPDSAANNNLPGANVQAVILNQINVQYGQSGCSVGASMGQFSTLCSSTPCSAATNPGSGHNCVPTAAQLKDLASYIGAYTPPQVTNFTFSSTVPYGGSAGQTLTTTQIDPNIVTMDVATADSGAYSGTANSIAKITDGAHGTVGISGFTMTYTSSTAGGYFATDTFKYTAIGSSSAYTSAQGTVTVNIAEPPVGAVSNAPPGVAVPFNTATGINLANFASGSYNTSFVVTAGPSHGSIGGTTFTPGTTITYTPTTGYSGTDTITFHVVGTPTSNVSGNGTINLTVGNPPAPTASNYTYPTAIAWDSTTNTIDLSSAVSDATTNHVVLSGSQPAGGTVTANGNLTLNYAANPNFAGGTDTFQYQAVGPFGLTSSAATVTVTVNGPPIPTIGNSSTTVPFKSTGTVLTLGTVTPTGDPVTNLHITTNPANGAAVVSGAPTNPIITYTPTSGYFGSDTVGYTASNGSGASTAATVTITVPQPGPPTSVAVVASASYSTATVIDLSSDFGGLASGLQIVAPGPANGVATVGTGANALKITYTPNAAFQGGADNFSYIALGYGTGNNSAPALIQMTVSAPGAPTTVPVTGPTVPYNSAPVSIPLAGAITSATAVTAAIATMPAHGIASITGTTASYQPAMGYFGADSFTFTAHNGGGTSNASAVSVTVSPPPAPTVSNLTLGVPFNAPAMLNLASPPAPATGPQGVYTSVALGTTAPSHGAVSLTGSTVTYTPTPGYFGTDTFTYIAVGPASNSTPGTVTVTVALPGAPVAHAGTLPVPYGAPANIDLSMNNLISGVYTSTAISSQPAHGTLSQTGTVITYTPAALYYGPDSFAYTATGPGGVSAPATISVTVALPGAPTVSSPTFSVTFNTPMMTNLASTVTGVYSTIQIVTAPTHGTASITGTTLTYTPAATFYGTDTLTFTAHGPGGTSTPGTITLNVVRPAAPVAAGANFNVTFDTALPINVVPYVTGIATSLQIATAPTAGTVTISGLTLSYKPNAGYFGADSFAYTATGPGGVSNAAIISLNVLTQAVKAWPTTMTVVVNGTGNVNLANFTSGSGLTGVGIATGPQHGQAVVTGEVLTYTPSPNFFGTDVLFYVAYGATGQSKAAKVTITVTGRPDPRQNPDVPGIVTSEGATAQRFVDTQISNFQTHLQSLHAVSPDDQDTSSKNPDAAFNVTPEQREKAALAASSATAQNAASASPGSASPVSAGALPQTAFGGARGGYATQSIQPIQSIPSASSSGSILPPQGSTTLANAVAPGNPQAPTGFGGATMQRAFFNPASMPLSGPPPAPAATDLTSLDLASLAGSMAAAEVGASVDHLGLSSTWVLGSVYFGSRTPGGPTQGFDTDGVSFGADYRLTNQLVIGVGAGYAQDKTLIGTDGTNTHANGTDIALYASFAPTTNTYVDAVLGIGSLSFNSERPVTQIDAQANSHRSGDQAFASIAAGYDWRDDGRHVTPYGRLDLSDSRLDSVSESGAAAYDLTYGEQNQASVAAALGIRLDTTQTFDYGQATPHVSLEYDHEFANNHSVNLEYASLVGGTNYPITPNILDRNTVTVGFGTDFLLRHGLTVGWDYEVLKSPGQETSQVIRVKLSQNLDKAFELPTITSNPFINIQTDFDYVYDDNVARSTDKLADQSWSLDFSRLFVKNLTDNLRVTADPTVGFEKFENYIGLSHADAGVKGQVQYRAEGDFGSPTYSLFARVTGSDYETAYRSGERYSVGGSVFVPLTDRINVFGEIGANQRHAQNEVWNDQDGYSRVSLDYALTPESSLYTGAEYRIGQLVSSGLPSLANLDTAEVYVRDPAFPGTGRVAYRVRGSEGLFNLGINTALSSTSSLDLSWRIVVARPDNQPHFYDAPTVRYIDHQWTLVYLVRF